MTSTDSAAPPDVAPTQTPAPSTPANSAGDIASGADAPVQPPIPSTTRVSAPQEAGSSGHRDWAWGAIIVIAGLIAIVVVFIFAVLEYRTAAEVTTAVGAVSGVIAALVGAYFGIRGATLAQVNAESSSSTQPKTKT